MEIHHEFEAYGPLSTGGSYSFLFRRLCGGGGGSRIWSCVSFFGSLVVFVTVHAIVRSKTVMDVLFLEKLWNLLNLESRD